MSMVNGLIVWVYNQLLNPSTAQLFLSLFRYDPAVALRSFGGRKVRTAQSNAPCE